MGRTCVGDVTLRCTCQPSTVEECLGRDPSAGSTTVSWVAFSK